MSENTIHQSEEITLTLSSATSYLLKSMFAEAQKRNDATAKNVRSIESFVESALDFAYQRKQSEWESRDKYNVNKTLGEAMRKVLSGKPLTKDEEKLVSAFREASVKAA